MIWGKKSRLQLKSEHIHNLNEMLRAVKTRAFFLDEFNHPFFERINSIVARPADIKTGEIMSASLTNDNFADFYRFAVGSFDAQTLSGGISA